jgi:hypothetical protein
VREDVQEELGWEARRGRRSGRRGVFVGSHGGAMDVLWRGGKAGGRELVFSAERVDERKTESNQEKGP